MSGDRRVDLNSIALILVAWDVGLEDFKKNCKSIAGRKEFISNYFTNESSREEIRKIVAHTVLERAPLYDLKEILKQLRRITIVKGHQDEMKKEQME